MSAVWWVQYGLVWQLAVGVGAAVVTYALGRLFGVTVGEESSRRNTYGLGGFSPGSGPVRHGIEVAGVSG